MTPQRPCACGSPDRTPTGGCRPCVKARNTTARARAARETYRTSAVAKARASERLRFRLYGLTPDQMRELLASQRGCCAVCLDTLPGGNQTHVDHDHDTGQVRGILCGDCNRAEGILKGSPLRAERLAAYLRKHAPKLNLRKAS